MRVESAPGQFPEFLRSAAKGVGKMDMSFREITTYCHPTGPTRAFPTSLVSIPDPALPSPTVAPTPLSRPHSPIPAAALPPMPPVAQACRCRISPRHATAGSPPALTPPDLAQACRRRSARPAHPCRRSPRHAAAGSPPALTPPDLAQACRCRSARPASPDLLHPHQVAVWFQNRRASWKTKQIERDLVCAGDVDLDLVCAGLVCTGDVDLEHRRPANPGAN